MAEKKTTVHIVGAGLAGSECAWTLAQRGHFVRLYEMRGGTMTPAHRTANFAELVCSNSFGSETDYSAPGQLKWEARQMNSLILQAADFAKIPAGMALGVDREKFSKFITEKIRQHPLIEVVETLVNSLDEVPRPTVIATGPLTHDNLAASMKEHFDSEFLYFFDAIAPVIDADSIDITTAFKADRFNRGTKDYYNCGMEKEQYQNFIREIQSARKIEPRDFEKDTPYFEGCMPIEAMIERGPETPRFGPMSPKGIRHPDNGRGYWAVVQLRQENKEATAYNMVGFQTKMAYGEQERIFRMIPGLERAEFLKLGSIHRNLYIQSPKKLTPYLQSRKDENLFFAGQITGVEGYFDSTCIGLLVGRMLADKLEGRPISTPPRETAFGSLLNAITEDNEHFQPTNINFGAFPNPADFKVRGREDKRLKKEMQLKFAKEAMTRYLGATMMTLLFCLVGLISGCQTSRSADRSSRALQKIVSEYTEHYKKLDPYHAAYFNDAENLDKFGDYPSPEYKRRYVDLNLDALKKLESVQKENLSAKDQRTYLLFKESLELQRSGHSLPWFYLDSNQMGSRLLSYLNSSSPQLSSFPFTSVKNFDAYVKRSEGFLSYVERQIAYMKEGLHNGYVLNCVIARKFMDSIRQGLEPSIENHPFLRPLSLLDGNFPAHERERLKKDFTAMVVERIRPGFLKFDRFLKSEYLPHCRASYGVGALPRGPEIYEISIRSATGLALSAEEIHQIGLKEVARIRAELETIKRRKGFKGSLTSYFAKRRQDPATYFSNTDEMLGFYAGLKKKVAPRLAGYFNTLPKTDYKIVAGENPQDAPARYSGPTELIPHGRFIVNTLNLRSTDKASATTLSLHEAMPGHHLQLARAFEMRETLSEYQRKIFFSAPFVEGWGLYAEHLGREIGLYEDDDQLFGHLSSELWRAVRLVADTGIHAMGWSRARTIKYMSENMAADISTVEAEADRYSVWPGQALSYKIGQLKILELRRRAERDLGEKFDLRKFHDMVLGSGNVSLSVLELLTNQWIKDQSPTISK